MISPEVRRTYDRVLSELGIKDFSFERRSKHPALVFELHGQKHRVSMSTSPSNRGHKNNIAHLKRLVRSTHVLT